MQQQQKKKWINKSEEVKHATSEMLLSKLRIHQVKDLYHLPPLFFLNSRNSHIFCQLLLCSLIIFLKSLLIFLFLKDVFFLSQESFCDSCLPPYPNAFLLQLNCSALAQKCYNPFHWSQPMTLVEHLQFIYSNKNESALIPFTCLLFSVALLCFRAIISAAV